MMQLLVIGKNKVPVKRRMKSTGFTLLELLIVVLIIGIVTTVAALALGDFGQSRKIKAVANRLSIVLPLAEQRAILEPSVLGLTFKKNGYEFYRLTINEKNKMSWQTIEDDKLLSFRAWPKNIGYNLSVEGKPAISPANGIQPQIIITPSGNPTPFILDIGKANQPPLVRIVVTGNGKVVVKKM